MEQHELVIVGGGLTAARAIASYRDAGGGGRIALLAQERVLPYHRPALSKRYLRGETGPPFAEDEAFYRDRDVDVYLDTPALELDARACTVVTPAGHFGYRQLLVATGASPQRLEVPGAELEGVHTLRTLDDSDRIRAAAARAERAVVVGGGFIGLETAASLRRLGLTVTLIHLGGGLFDQLGSPELSSGLLALYRNRGVEVLLGEEVARFGGDQALEYVEAKSGVCVAAELAIVGVGVRPNVDFLAGSGIELENGVVVNERFETAVPGVYAAGDVASFFDPLYGRRRRIEHWSNANYQGTEVGRILAGGDGGYDTLSSFFSEVFDTTIKVFGDTGGAEQLRAKGSLEGGAFLAPFGRDGRLVGAISVGQSDELETLVKELIKERAPADALTRELTSTRSR